METRSEDLPLKGSTALQIILSFALGTILSSVFFLYSYIPNGGHIFFRWERPALPMPPKLPISSGATCSFKRSVFGMYGRESAQVTYETGIEDERDTVTFMGLDDGKVVKIRATLGDVDADVLENSDEHVVMIQKSLGGAIDNYTLYRKTGIAVHTQQHENPSVGQIGVLEIGYCY
jgi:hypothetical protein